MRPGNFCGAPMTRVTFLTLSLFPTFDRADVFRENNTRGVVESSSLRDIECTRRTSRFLKFGHCRNFCGMYVRTRRQSFACRDLLIATIIAIFTITIPSFFLPTVFAGIRTRIARLTTWSVYATRALLHSFSDRIT